MTVLLIAIAALAAYILDHADTPYRVTNVVLLRDDHTINDPHIKETRCESALRESICSQYVGVKRSACCEVRAANERFPGQISWIGDSMSFYRREPLPF